MRLSSVWSVCVAIMVFQEAGMVSAKARKAIIAPPGADSAVALRHDVETLATTIGERHTGRPKALAAAADCITSSLTATGCIVRSQEYKAGGVTCRNIEAELQGSGPRAGEIVVFGAHYDSVPGTPGADDNASARCRAPRARARDCRAPPPARTVRFVAFVNEEPPYYHTDLMGSRVYARRCRERGDKVVGMVCLEMVGFYSQTRGSQSYPLPAFKLLYPSTGNFVAVTGDTGSASLVRLVHRFFAAASDFPCVKASAPRIVPGVDFSDQWSFWEEGYKAVMITDTSFYRNGNYHEQSDTPDTLDYPGMARVVRGLEGALKGLAGTAPLQTADSVTTDTSSSSANPPRPQPLKARLLKKAKAKAL